MTTQTSTGYRASATSSSWGACLSSRRLNLAEDAPLSLEVVEDATRIDVSSTELRQRLREGRSVRYLLPAAVETYAREKGLYR